MTKRRAEDTTVEETAIGITRSSPRRRKLGRGEETDGLDTLSPASQSVKKQRRHDQKGTGQTAKPEVDLGKPEAHVDGDSDTSPPKRRSRAAILNVEEIGSHDPEAEHEKKGLKGNNSIEAPTRKRKGKETPKRSRKIKGENSGAGEIHQVLNGDSPKKRKRQHKTKEISKKVREIIEQNTDIDDENKDPDGETPKKPKHKRKTKEEKAAEAMPLASRTTGLRMYVGAHVSIAKGVQNSITNSHHIGGNAFALFLKSQRKWDNPALSDDSRDAFHAHCRTHKYDAASHVLPHGSYLVNLAQEDKDKAKQAYDAFLDDLHRCESLGVKLYNFHPGAASSSPLPEAIRRIANHLNTALACTETVTPVLENMAGSGTVIGSRFSDLRDIISHVEPRFQPRIGVCIDTCHAFAAGYDLRTPESFTAVLREFDNVVGMRYLKALHLNDSKAPLGSKRDLHQNIGLGFLGLRAFHNVMNEPRFEDLPLILETPCERPDPHDEKGKKMVEDKGVWAQEIKLLEGLIGMDVESEAFRKLETELSERGREEREKMTRAVGAKEEKERRKVEKGQRSLVDMMNGAATTGKGKGKGINKKGKERKMEEAGSAEDSESG
jgi:AP endonuclease 1